MRLFKSNTIQRSNGYSSKRCERLSLGSTSELAEITVVLLAPAGFIYSWHFYFTQIRRAPTGWRNRVTMLSLALASLAVLLWPVMVMLMPRADWGSGVGVDASFNG